MATEGSSAKKETIVVIGNGMVGYKFCEKFAAKNGTEQYKLLVFGEEPRPAYDRVHLSEYFSGKSAEDLLMAPASWYIEKNIELCCNEKIISVDPVKKEITTDSDNKISYFKLILATGSSCFIPPIPGIKKAGVIPYRTIEDLDQIKEYAAKSKSGAVIGGGLLGLEAAKALMDLGIETHVVEFASRLMPRQLDETGSILLKEKLENLGISIHLNKNTAEISGQEAVQAMKFSDGSELEVDMIVVSAGIKPRDELARSANLQIGPRGGIVVNNLLETNDPDIYAIGECALHFGMIYGLIAPGYEMAEVVASNILGENKEFTGFDMSTKLKLIGIDVASFGNSLEDARTKKITYENKTKGIYKRINISEDGKYLLGGILVGDASEYNMLLQMVNNKMSLPEDAEDLILPSKSAAEPGAGLMSLPDSALICSCEGISKGDICTSINYNDLTDLSGIKKCTKAGTGCGGCVPMLNDLLAATLKSGGKAVKQDLCEHFAYTRQELFSLIKSTRANSFEEILFKYGKGHGCETCKPAIASMLASIWNDMILRQASIQDTNDRFLANIQKGGTYSIVPRIPGGEITADKLVVLGEVAKKYDLYCKITGGQRIDLFGAQLHELPIIWKELIEAGFESGHAYGKALRTVKSCVGSTWCRFGVQDSVTFAIEIEDRYKGLRAPHKLKSAVSGCVRECAEAQSKDFGIIATDKGWNLYVCGNGGAKPQHAKLLASDLDKETCIRYIDRFLMFYIRTAEPLTRTAPWLNKLEGGIDYLKDVVINDILGIGKELEADMAYHVQTYKCEWKDAVEDPDKRKMFNHFVNVNEPDPSVKFVPMRGQKMPADWNTPSPLSGS